MILSHHIGLGKRQSANLNAHVNFQAGWTSMQPILPPKKACIHPSIHVHGPLQIFTIESILKGRWETRLWKNVITAVHPQ